MSNSTFKIAGITYTASECSNGQTPQGEITGKGAARMIKERGLSDLSVLDICCGVGIVGLTMFAELGRKAIADMTFADINVFNIMSLRATLTANGLKGFRSYVSDGLMGIPDDSRFDLIVSNPPHLYMSKDWGFHPETSEQLGTFDVGWDFHEKFYRDCHHYLKDNGEVWFLENTQREYAGIGTPKGGFMRVLAINDNLKSCGILPEPLDKRFVWAIMRLKGENE